MNLKKTPSAYREEVQDALRGPFFDVLEQYLIDLHTTDDPEIRRKGLEFFSKVLSLEPEKKANPYDTLPVIQVNIGPAGSVQLQTVPPPDSANILDATDITPTPRMQAFAAINQELLEA